MLTHLCSNLWGPVFLMKHLTELKEVSCFSLLKLFHQLESSEIIQLFIPMFSLGLINSQRENGHHRQSGASHDLTNQMCNEVPE